VRISWKMVGARDDGCQKRVLLDLKTGQSPCALQHP
jgi:hypothetical protein